MKILKFFLIFLLSIIHFFVFSIEFYPSPVVESVQVFLRKIYSLQKHIVQVENRKWAYLRGGKGEVVLLIHGYGSNKDRWYPLINNITDKFAVIAPDLPGFGETEVVKNDNYRILAQTRNLHNFLKAIPVEKYHLVGISMGGAIATAYAANYPGKVKSLVIIDSYGIKSKHPGYITEKYGEYRKNIFVYSNIKEQDLLNSLIVKKKIYIPSGIKKYFLAKRIRFFQRYLKVYEDLEKDGEDFLNNYLEKIDCPSIIIWGEDDKIFNKEAAYIFKNKIKGSELFLLKNAGHVPLIDRPVETVRIIKNFIEENN